MGDNLFDFFSVLRIIPASQIDFENFSCLESLKSEKLSLEVFKNLMILLILSTYLIPPAPSRINKRVMLGYKILLW